MFNKLNVPIVGGNKKQRELKQELNDKIKKAATLSLLEWQIERKFMIVPFIKNSVDNPQRPTNMTKTAMFDIDPMTDEQLDSFQKAVEEFKNQLNSK